MPLPVHPEAPALFCAPFLEAVVSRWARPCMPGVRRVGGRVGGACGRAGAEFGCHRAPVHPKARWLAWPGSHTVVLLLRPRRRAPSRLQVCGARVGGRCGCGLMAWGGVGVAAGVGVLPSTARGLFGSKGLHPLNWPNLAPGFFGRPSGMAHGVWVAHCSRHPWVLRRLPPSTPRTRACFGGPPKAHPAPLFSIRALSRAPWGALDSDGLWPGPGGRARPAPPVAGGGSHGSEYNGV